VFPALLLEKASGGEGKDAKVAKAEDVRQDFRLPKFGVAPYVKVAQITLNTVMKAFRSAEELEKYGLTSALKVSVLD